MKCLLVALLSMAGLAMAAEDGKDLPEEVVINQVEFIKIPAGDFFKTGGIPGPGKPYGFLRDYYDQPGRVRVWLDTYYIGKYEARARDFIRYMNATRPESPPPVLFDSCTVGADLDGVYAAKEDADDHPATNLSWVIADRWARWMGFRLLTEAEWEKAASGTDQRTFPWGNDPFDDTFAGADSSGPRCRTWPVHSFEKGKSPYGVYNMAGNVAELVADWYNADYDRGLIDGVRNPQPALGSIDGRSDNDKGPWKLLKGGRWGSDSEELQISARMYFPLEKSFRCYGTRFALDAATVVEHLKAGTATIARPAGR